MTSKIAKSVNIPGLYTVDEACRKLVVDKWEMAKAWWTDAAPNLQTFYDSLETILSDMERKYSDLENTLDETKVQDLVSGVNFGTKPGTVPTKPTPALNVTGAPEWADPGDTYDLVGLPAFPTFSHYEPTVTIPAAPSTALPPAPENEYVIDFPYEDYPPPLDIGEIPPVPLLTDFDIPPMPPIHIPAWDTTAPEITIEPLEIYFNWTESPYVSDLKDKLYAKLVGFVVDGGTGLGEDIEDALWQRARDRQLVPREKTYTEAEQYFSARGYILPPGALSGRLLEAAQEQNRLDEQINYEIMVEQARLAFDMTKFTLTSSLQMEQQLMNYCNQVNQRGLEAAKTSIEAAVQIQNAKIAYFNLLLDKYKTEAAVFETRLRAALAEVEIYKTQIQALSLITEIDKSRVEAYKAQLQGISLLVDVYKSRLQAVQIKTEIEKLKIEIFRLEVESYVAQVNAKVAEYSLYQARISGEKAKVEVYSEQVKAYGARVEATRAQWETKIREVEAKVKKLDGLASAYNSEVRQYEAEVNKEVARVKAETDVYNAEVGLYKAESDFISSTVDAQIKEFLGKLEILKTKATVDLDKARQLIEQTKALYEAQLEAAKSSGQVSAQLSASAMAAMSAQVQIDSSANQSLQGSVSEGETWNHAFEE